MLKNKDTDERFIFTTTFIKTDMAIMWKITRTTV